MSEYSYAVCSGLLGGQNSRWMSYQPPRNIEEKLELAGRIQGLDGLELGYPGDFQDWSKLKSLLDRYDLAVPAVNLKLRGPKTMYQGSFSSPTTEAVETARKWGKEALDAAAEVGAYCVTTCPLNDGFDYPFETDYADSWYHMVDAIGDVASHRDDINLAVEYKLSDPRTRSLLTNVGETLLFARQTGRANVGVTLDLGHCLIARENPAMSVALAAGENRLFHVHLNDNDRVADIDLMTGTVHFWETLEFLHYLHRYSYSGWLVSDVYPKSLDPAAFFSATIRMQKTYVRLSENLYACGLEEPARRRDLLGVLARLNDFLES